LIVSLIRPRHIVSKIWKSDDSEMVKGELPTAVEGICLGVLIGQFTARVGGGVLDSTGPARGAGQGSVVGVHEEGGCGCEQHIADVESLVRS
jgi:hypothetical protein